METKTDRNRDLIFGYAISDKERHWLNDQLSKSYKNNKKYIVEDNKTYLVNRI